MYIKLIQRPDRMGANLTWYFMQLIYAHYHNYFVKIDEIKYENSIFMKAIVVWTNRYNSNIESTQNRIIDNEIHVNWIQDSQQDWPGNNMIVCKEIGCDLITYFRRHIYEEYREILGKIASIEKYPLLENAKKTICIHLRLDDVTDRFDYDGHHSTLYYSWKLDTDNIKIDLNEEVEWGHQCGVHMQGYGRHFNSYDCQAPLSKDKLKPIIDDVTKLYPHHRIVVISSPKGQIDLPEDCKYEHICSTDPSLDLWFLCQADVLICSRSLFCFSAVYCGKSIDTYVPMWGHIAGTGLTSKYDEIGLNYFY